MGRSEWLATDALERVRYNLGTTEGEISGERTRKRRSTKHLRFLRFFFEGRCSIQLSYGRTDDRSDSKPLLDFVSTYLELDHARASSSG